MTKRDEMTAMPRALWTFEKGHAFAIVGTHVLALDPGLRNARDADDAAELAHRWNQHAALTKALHRLLNAERAPRTEWIAAVAHARAVLSETAPQPIKINRNNYAA
jgi:hypothetical protein